MNYMKIIKASVADGAGVRVALYVSGCSQRCTGCFNPESWNFKAGKAFDEAAKQELFDALDKPHIKGLTLSGGHPLENDNVDEVYNLICEIKERFPDKDIWLYTGYSYECLDIESNRSHEPDMFDVFSLFDYDKWRIVKLCDVLVDGKYIEEEKDITLRFKGSRNQRVIDVKKTLRQGKIVLYCD